MAAKKTPDDAITASLVLFRAQERARARISYRELRLALEAERATRPLTRAGTVFRFSDEIEALRFYVLARLRCCGASTSLPDMKSPVRIGSSAGPRTSRTQTIRAKGSRIVRTPLDSASFVDYLDIGSRLRDLDQDGLECLIEHYVLGHSIVRVARSRHIGAGQAARRISAARFQLRKALIGMVPSEEETDRSTGTAAVSSEVVQPISRRRTRLVRLIEHRLEGRGIEVANGH